MVDTFDNTVFQFYAGLEVAYVFDSPFFYHSVMRILPIDELIGEIFLFHLLNLLDILLAEHEIFVAELVMNEILELGQ